MNTARILGLAAAATTTLASLALLVPQTASAAPLVHTVNTVTEVSCAFGTTTGEGGSFQAGSSSDDQSIGSQFLVENRDERIVLAGEGGTASFGSRFTAAVTAVEPGSGRVTGTATVAADLSVGEPVVEQIDDRDGNIRTTGTISRSEFSFGPVTMTVPGFTVVDSEQPCSGSRMIFDLWSTNPRVHVVTQRGFDSQTCDVAGIPDGQVRLSGETRRAPYAEFAIMNPTSPAKAQGEIAMQGRSGTLRTPLRDLGTDEEVAELDLRLALTRVGPAAVTVDQEDKSITVRKETPYRASVVAKISDGRRGQVACAAGQVVTTTLTFRR